MTIREQKGIFGFVVLFMFGGYLSAVITCPPPTDNELPLVFLLGVATTLFPAFAFLESARWLSAESK